MSILKTGAVVLAFIVFAAVACDGGKSGAVPKSDSIRASHILILHQESARGQSTRSKTEANELAREIHRKLVEEDASFEQLAKQYSDCPSRVNGGDLGTIKKGDLNSAFETAAFSLKTNKVSDIVETDLGYHIILRTE